MKLPKVFFVGPSKHIPLTFETIDRGGGTHLQCYPTNLFIYLFKTTQLMHDLPWPEAGFQQGYYSYTMCKLLYYFACKWGKNVQLNSKQNSVTIYIIFYRYPHSIILQAYNL